MPIVYVGYGHLETISWHHLRLFLSFYQRYRSLYSLSNEVLSNTDTFDFASTRTTKSELDHLCSFIIGASLQEELALKST